MSGRSNFVRGLTRSERLRTHGTAVLVTGALVVLFGGYAGGWKWTGFPANNQLWDWLNLLLLPVVIGTVLLPAALKWISGNAAHRATEARRLAVRPS